MTAGVCQRALGMLHQSNNMVCCCGVLHCQADADIAAARMQDPRFSDPADALDPTDKSEAALIARAFQRTDRQINETVWDADVTVFVLYCD